MIKSYLRSSLLVCAFIGSLSAQGVVQGLATGPKPPEKKEAKRSLAMQAGLSYSVINNHFETNALYKPGLNLGLVHRISPWFALEGTFTRFLRHDAISLGDIQSWNVDLNGQLSMQIGESDLYFRTIFGVGYIDWKGYYVGPNLNDNYHYYYGKLLNDRFFTGNLGWGFSHKFMKQRLEGFGDFRLRFAGDKKVVFSIVDTGFLFGLRYNIPNPVRTLESGKANGRKTAKQKNSRMYRWVKNRK